MVVVDAQLKIVHGGLKLKHQSDNVVERLIKRRGL
jgi:hypothetical protein